MTVNFSRISTQVLVGGGPVAIPSLRQHALRVKDGVNDLAVSSCPAAFVLSLQSPILPC